MFTICCVSARRPALLFWLFCACHLAAWTLVPAFFQPNPHIDTIEACNWGHHWQWGYPKHPPLAPWLAEAVWKVSGARISVLYLAGQLSVIACFWAVWRLGLHLFSGTSALLGVLLLDGLFFYNVDSQNLNPNTLSLPFWALTVLFFWRAINSGGPRNWLLCGMAAGLGLLTKYAIGFLLLPLSLYLLCSRHRKFLGRTGPYLAAATSLTLFLPHLIWVFQNRFVTVNYALARATPRPGTMGHVLLPIRFVFQELSLVAFMLALAAFLIPWRSSQKITSSPRRPGNGFLFAAAVGPFLTLLALSALFGFSIQRTWGTTLWSFGSVFIVQLLGAEFSNRTLRHFTCAWICFQILLVACAVAYLQRHSLLRTRPDSRFYPGRAVTASVYAQWYKFYAAPPAIVAGSRFPGENIGFFGTNRPDVYVELDPAISPWINDEDLRNRGGVIVVENREIPEEWLKRFPNAKVQPPVEAASSGHSADHIQLRMAFVPPTQSALVSLHSSSGAPAAEIRSCCFVFSTLNREARSRIILRTSSNGGGSPLIQRRGLIRATTPYF